ncbi:MAG TPA: type II CAAX endopeptidase family protein [Pyrinomonadaceae bacterium]|jgi:membrane protease YdiL (CAAX protease family)|nr:type II CAAX endopeptidase family protein [Pyrinomonadaceae bacterium]
MHRIFLNDFGRLRSGWRVLLFIFAFVAALFLLATVLRVAYLVLVNVGPSIPGQALVADAIFRLTMLIAALGAGYVCARLFEGLPWRSLGLTFHRSWLRDLLVGCTIGFAALAFAVVIATAAGGLTFTFGGSGLVVAIIRSLVGSAVLLFLAALAEEALFRGYVLQTFTRAQLTLLGVLLTSVPFALIHLSNPNVVPGVTFANTALAGIWLAAAYLRTRSLWFPLGVHWAWNWALGAFFGLPISGINLVSNPVLKGNDLGPAWLTGGSYGIEGGAACTVALIAFTFLVWRMPWVTADPELKQLTSEENFALPSPVATIRPADDVA